MKFKTIKILILILILNIAAYLVFFQCGKMIARFDPASLKLAEELKAESLNLITRANEPYNRYQKKITVLKHNLETGYLYARSKPKNQLAAKQWEILKNPQRNLLGGFLAKWEKEKQLNPVFIDEAKKVISDAFDTIIDLERNKPVDKDKQ